MIQQRGNTRQRVRSLRPDLADHDAVRRPLGQTEGAGRPRPWDSVRAPAGCRTLQNGQQSDPAGDPLPLFPVVGDVPVRLRRGSGEPFERPPEVGGPAQQSTRLLAVRGACDRPFPDLQPAEAKSVEQSRDRHAMVGLDLSGPTGGVDTDVGISGHHPQDGLDVRPHHVVEQLRWKSMLCEVLFSGDDLAYGGVGEIVDEVEHVGEDVGVVRLGTCGGPAHGRDGIRSPARALVPRYKEVRVPLDARP